MHLDIDGTGGAFMTSLWQLKRFEARIPLFKSLDCHLALAAAGMNQRFTRYPPVINHNLGWCNWPVDCTGFMMLILNFMIISTFGKCYMNFIVVHPMSSYFCKDMILNLFVFLLHRIAPMLCKMQQWQSIWFRIHRFIVIGMPTSYFFRREFVRDL